MILDTGGVRLLMTQDGREGGGSDILSQGGQNLAVRARAFVCRCVQCVMLSNRGDENPGQRPSRSPLHARRGTYTDCPDPKAASQPQATETAQLCVCILRMCAARLCCQVHHGRTNRADHTPATVHLSSPTTISKCLGVALLIKVRRDG